MNKAISVVIPVYNEERYIRECLDSVVNQSKKDIEIIIVDDGSTDNSGAICDMYSAKDSRITVVHQDNKGKIAARRKGVMCSQADYVTFVDADDFIDSTSFILAEEFIRADIDVICFNISNYYDGIIADRNIYLPEGRYDKIYEKTGQFAKWIYDENIDGFQLQPSLCTKIVKRELLNNIFNIVGDLSINYAEDRLITYMVLKNANTVQIISNSYYRARHRKNHYAKEYTSDNLFLEKLFEYYEFLKGQFSGSPDIERALALSYIQMVNDRKAFYNVWDKSYRYLFPYEKIDKEERIILYGAGKVGQDYYRQITELSYCKVVLWVDGNPDWYGTEISPVEKIMSMDFDRIVIAIKSDAARRDIKRKLINIGIEEKKII
ncbi:glycosyltransferase family 2 protein [Butyrivibrio sp. AC2005]|uniref:glycosyltransferase family 2 protein n=1 Tax=Butyrivibrio sp. AC2005 TaxID=1280672 RepID=UPI000416CA51|nr:glycosyltransferase family 2 protein [Butyrivibrio sp. AC2005]